MLNEKKPGFLGIGRDVSGSTAQCADVIASQCNAALQELLNSFPRRGGMLRDILRVAAIDFGDSVNPSWSGPLAGRDYVSLPELEEHYLRLEAAAPGDDSPGRMVWFEARASGQTPMLEALELANELTDRFAMTFPNSDKPTWIFLTDGQPTTGDPQAAAEALKQKALVFNIFVDTSGSGSKPVLFPARAKAMRNDYARTLFELSSELPPHVVPLAQAALGESTVIEQGARAFATDVDPRLLARLFEIGTWTQVVQP